jgi:hypothetical protein
MKTHQRRLEKLERQYLTGPGWQDTVKRWREAHERGLYFDLATREAVTLDNLSEPYRSRIMDAEGEAKI